MEDTDRARLRETRDIVLRIEERLPPLNDRVTNLERNQRWGVIALLTGGFSILGAWVKDIIS